MELKASDLRIGNYIRSKSDKKYYKVVRLYSDTDIDITTEPIPITGQRLLKCGFEYMPHRKEYFKKLDINTSLGILKDGTIKINSRYIDNKINYIHELQNLIFALNKQELEINL